LLCGAQHRRPGTEAAVAGEARALAAPGLARRAPSPRTPRCARRRGAGDGCPARARPARHQAAGSAGPGLLSRAQRRGGSDGDGRQPRSGPGPLPPWQAALARPARTGGCLMSPEDDERRLRAALAEAHRRDAETTPPFARVWAADRSPASHPAIRWGVVSAGGAAGGPGALVWLGRAPPSSVGPPPRRRGV